MAVRVLISDDHPLVRQSLQWLLSREADTESFATVEDQPAILETLYNHDVDVVILNMRDHQSLKRHRFAGCSGGCQR